MQRILPQELHDIVYVYLLDGNTFHMEESDVKSIPYRPRCVHLKEKIRVLGYGHLCEGTYTTPPIMHESAEAWYRRTSFTFASLNLQPRFLRPDIWHLRLPVGQLL